LADLNEGRDERVQTPGGERPYDLRRSRHLDAFRVKPAFPLHGRRGTNDDLVDDQHRSVLVREGHVKREGNGLQPIAHGTSEDLGRQLDFDVHDGPNHCFTGGDRGAASSPRPEWREPRAPAVSVLLRGCRVKGTR
jgi:hypothetical protein